jgi:dihydropteroate synthase
MSSVQLNWKALGIINLTPDSFSDGGESIVAGGLQKKLKNYRSNQVNHFDIGAESTAPFNGAITSETEWHRINKHFLPFLKEFHSDDVLSFDTYKIDVIKKILIKLEKENFNNQVIWNDVSGKFDQDVMDLLCQYPKLHYVYSHNLAPSRALCSSHMNYIKEGLTKYDFISNVRSYFRKVALVIDDSKIDNLQSRIIFDPCFGFSKTQMQNYYLIQDMHLLIKDFSEFRWMLGISRKSFLKKMASKNEQLCTGKDCLEYREFAHLLILSHWKEEFGCKNCMIRLHDSRLFSALTECQKMFELP